MTEVGAGQALRLHVMTANDVAEVMAVERQAYERGWPATAFERELTQNNLARYIVLRADNGRDEGVVGFAGLWLMVDEAHVVTVAVAPGSRRRGYGRLLLHGLMDVAMRESMFVATLECRVSNEAARALYRRYGFYEVGTRKRYYADNHEDAVIMTTEELESNAYRDRYARLAEELELVFPGLRLSPG